MKVIIKQIDDRKGAMHEMYMSYCMRCACRAAPHVHLVLHEMYMSYSALHRKKEDISKRKTVIVYERRFMILL